MVGTPYRANARRLMTTQDVAFLEKYCLRARVGAAVLLGVWVLAIGLHARSASYAAEGHPGLLENLLLFAVGVDVLLWCVLDAPLQEKYFEHAFVLPFLVSWPVTLAVYLMWTRGVRHGLFSYAAALATGTGVLVVGALLGACAAAL